MHEDLQGRPVRADPRHRAPAAGRICRAGHRRRLAGDRRSSRTLIDFADPWDFEEVYGKLLDFARAYPFDPEAEDYLVHITTGTHVAQICLFLLTEARYLPGKLLQTQPAAAAPARSAAGTWSAIDLDLSRYDSIATRFAAPRPKAARSSSPASRPATPPSTG